MLDFTIYADYHTHTRMSDGKMEMEDIVEAAIAKGLTEVAITDHGPGHLSHGLKRDKLPEMRRKVDELNERYEGQIKVFLGVEANILSLGGEIDVTDEDRKYYDLVLMGFHRFVRYRPHAFSHFMLKALAKKDNKYLIEKSTDAFIEAIQHNTIDCITHPGDPLPLNLMRLGKACVETGTVLEINCKHANMSAQTLIGLSKIGVDFLVGSDAHHKEQVGAFDWAIQLIADSGVNKERVLNVKPIGG